MAYWVTEELQKVFNFPIIDISDDISELEDGIYYVKASGSFIGEVNDNDLKYVEFENLENKIKYYDI